MDIAQTQNMCPNSPSPWQTWIVNAGMILTLEPHHLLPPEVQAGTVDTREAIKASTDFRVRQTENESWAISHIVGSSDKTS